LGKRGIIPTEILPSLIPQKRLIKGTVNMKQISEERMPGSESHRRRGKGSFPIGGPYIPHFKTGNVRRRGGVKKGGNRKTLPATVKEFLIAKGEIKCPVARGCLHQRSGRKDSSLDIGHF